MKLLSPKTDVSRPIIDRVKESLFSVLHGYGLPEGKMVADLFSGVGSLGLESLSRGAEFVTFVENEPRIAAILKKNIEKAGFVKESKVIEANAFKIGAPVDFDGRRYDIVFVDPPYSATKEVGENSPLSRLMMILSGQIAPDGIIVIRTHKRTELLEQYVKFKIEQCRVWGTMAVTIFRQKQDD